MEEEETPTQWQELDSDEIASVTSEQLHEHRPNRWEGPKSTWRTLTEDERLTVQAMKSIRDRDLGVHLYNTFALRKRGRDPATAQDLTIQTEDGQDAVWAPPRLWTAWPLGGERLPMEDFVAREEDEDEVFTFRKEEIKMPSSDLQEEISAHILRLAKERFRKRKRTWASIRPSIEEHAGSTAGEGSEDDATETESRATSPAVSRAASSNHESGEEREHMTMDVESGDEAAAGPSTPKSSHKDPVTHGPVVSADDELSYELLAPPVRHIISQLDSTLGVLHSIRAIALGYESDSSTADEDSDSQASSTNSPVKRPRGRPRKECGEEKRPKATKRGRPRKVHVPLEGESYEDMMIRVAREGHRCLPTKVEDPGAAAEEPVTAGEDPDTAFEEWVREGDERLKREQAQAQRTPNRRRGVKRWGLRDWSDVIGAASLAGFSPDVVARTTRRCANLFGETMTIRNLREVPASHGTGIQSTDYRPEPIRLSPSDANLDSSSSEAGSALVQRRIKSRQSSVTGSSPSSSSRARSRSLGRSSSQNRSRSRSRSASAGQQHFCPVPTCERAAHAFSRRANLRRHMSLVHGDEEVAASEGDIDSEDEVLGGVHVDGFLRPVVPSLGWRGEDMMPRKRKRYYAERRARMDEESDNATESGYG